MRPVRECRDKHAIQTRCRRCLGLGYGGYRALPLRSVFISADPGRSRSCRLGAVMIYIIWARTVAQQPRVRITGLPAGICT